MCLIIPVQNTQLTCNDNWVLTMCFSKIKLAKLRLVHTDGWEESSSNINLIEVKTRWAKQNTVYIDQSELMCTDQKAGKDFW